MKYSLNSAINQAIEALLTLGCPPIPVAPKQNPRDEWCHRVVRTKDGYLFCPLDKDLAPIPKFTGKNPSYLDRNGSPRICKHGEFQNRLPTDTELQQFFCHPNTGIGTLGGHAGVDWLDFDAKCYESQEACDKDVENIIERANLHNTWIERTGSGGWRIAVRPLETPTFTNFTTSSEGQHVGEALFEGRFTVLAPSFHPNGNPYRRISGGLPLEVASLESIGIYPSKNEQEQAKRNQVREQRKARDPNYGEPTNPQDNPWDIRNFAHYFEGYHERGDGWAAAKCPHHNGNSQSSFRVRLDTGEYKLWCGCDTKNVYKSGLALAIADGYKAPRSDINIPKNQIEPEWKVKARGAWRKNRQFLANVKESAQWCSFARPGANTIAFFKAGLGRGKTTRLRAWVKEWKQAEDVSFLCLGYRNTLLLQLCGDKKGLGFHHLHEHSGMLMKSASGEGIALCIDSLWRFSPEDFDDKIIILDEVKSVVKHLLHSTTVKNRDKIINLFAEAIRRARQVICLDGLMTDWVVDYLHSLAPEKQIIKAENTYLGEKPKVNFLLGTVGTDDKLKVNDRSPWLKYLLEESPMPAVCSDSQVMIEALDGLLSAKGLRVLRVDSKTVTEQYVKDFLLNCDEYIEQHKPDVLLYTPSAESGVDVSIPNHFTHHFAFFFGVLDIDGILQMLGRIRDNIVKFVWCKSFVADDERQHSGSPFTDQIAKSINEILIGDIATSVDGDNWLDTVGNHLKAIIANSIDQNFRTSCIIKSIQNYEKSNLRECLREVLVESGYKVVNCTLESYEEAGKKTKEATEAVKRQNSADIFRAEKVAPELVDELKFDASWVERCKVIQAKLREKLPGIDDSSVWTEDFIYLVRYGDRNFINSLENYWLFTHPDVAKRQSQDNLHWMARRLHTFIGNVKIRWARIHALLEMNFERFLDPDKEWSNESPELVALVELGKKHSNALGRHPGKSTPVQFLGGLLGLLGLKLKSRKDSEGKRWYHLDEEVISDPVRQRVLICIETKLTQPKEKIDWEAAINEAHGIQTENQPQTQAEQGLKGAAPSLQILYTNQLEGAVNNSLPQSHDVAQILGGVSEVVEQLAAVDTPDRISQTAQNAISPQDSQPHTSAVTENDVSNEDANFCLESLVKLESESVSSDEGLIALFEEMECRGQRCESLLPADFWQRASSAIGRVTKALRGRESQLQSAVRLLREAIAHGADTVRSVLGRWTPIKRWEAISRLESDSDEDMERLMQVVPDWAEWSFAEASV